MNSQTIKRVMSGMRPTGRLHLGHYFGVLQNWVSLQAQYPCFFMVADWHALTTRYEQPQDIPAHTLEVVLDWLAAGIDPQKALIYRQSDIPEIIELHMIFSMLTPTKWVETDPTLKDMVQSGEDLHYGLLGYPILQTADILAPRANLVPVGKDQVAHLEISRDIVTRFNHLYGGNIFEPPQPLLAPTALLPGLDNRKMSKSYGNTIDLADTEDETAKKLKQAITDPARIRRDDPGNPEQCQVVFPYYQLFATADQVQAADSECRSASRGCMDCKKILIDAVNGHLRPLRDRRALYAQDPHQVESLLKQGAEAVRDTTQETLTRVKKQMGLLH